MDDGDLELGDPEAVFGVVANDVRLEILHGLWDGKREKGDGLTFSELYDRTAVDDSGRFNYHLDKLTPRFVSKDEQYYTLTATGEQLIGTLYGGRYTATEEVAFEPTVVGSCPDCGGDVVARYEAGSLDVSCDQCEMTVTDLPAPPAMVARHDAAELPTVISRRLEGELHFLNHGICRLCSGPVDRSLARFTDAASAQEGDVLTTVFACRVCGDVVRGTLGSVLVHCPPVVSFLYDNGVDLDEATIWDQQWLFDLDGAVTSSDPVRIETAIEVGGNRLELVLDGALDVVEATRA